MSPFIKFSQASKHSNTIAATYRLIQRSFFGLMSVLLVTTLSVAMVGQISVSAISNEISQDPVVLAQQYLDNSQNSVSFTKSKSLESVIKYFITNNFEASNIYAYSSIKVDNQFLDIPFNVDLSKDLTVSQKSFEDSKNRLISNIKLSKTDKQDSQAPAEIDLGEVSLNIKEAQTISDTKLDEIISSKSSIAINKVLFTAKSNNPTIKSFEKSSKKIEIQKKSALSKTTTNNDTKNNNSITDKDIESVTTKKPTEAEKAKVLDEAQKIKEGIARKENERFIGETIVKPMKEKAVIEQIKNQKQKAKEIKKLIKDGKKSQIKIEDVYALGEESKNLGIDIFVPERIEDTTTQTKINIDESKALNYVEDRQVSFLDSILSFGSIQASAFSPSYTNTYVYHAKPNTHFGTVLDLYNGNQNNGATIGMWYKNTNNSWNQKFDFFSDDTIRVGGKCLDMSDYGKINRGENANGVKIHLWDCNGGWSQKWVHDTEGLLRLKGNTSYCLDASSGGANSSIFTSLCGSTTYTEAFRAGEYAIRIYGRRGAISQANVGHAFVSLARYNNYNNVVGLTSYSLWPDPKDTDNLNNSGWYDSISGFTTMEENDRSNRGSWDNVNVNNTSDITDGYDGTQRNDFHANANRTSYWQKIITPYQANDLINSGYDVGYGLSTYNYTGFWCTSYSRSLWNKYGGIGLQTWTPAPIDYYNAFLSTQIYY